MSDWSDEETDDPTHADRRNFYKVEQWSRDGQHVFDLDSPAAASTSPRCSMRIIKHRPRDPLHPAADESVERVAAQMKSPSQRCAGLNGAWQTWRARRGHPHPPIQAEGWRQKGLHQPP